MKTTVKQPTALAARAPGFGDLLPGAAAVRRALEDRMLHTFRAWGYELLETPAVELLSTLELGVGPERLRRLFKFSDGDGRMLAMVGERTVPVARLAAGQLRQAALPLRLCYLGPTFEGHPAPGSGRQAFQAGAELIGAHGAPADAEDARAQDHVEKSCRCHWIQASEVFLSYSHDSPEHEGHALAGSDHLRKDGLNA